MPHQIKLALILLCNILFVVVLSAQEQPSKTTTTETDQTIQKPETLATDNFNQKSKSGLSDAKYWKSPDGSLFANAMAEFELSSKDDHSGVAQIYYSTNHDTFKRYQGPFRLQKSGLNRIQYYSVDQSGNKERLRLYHVSLDKMPPVLAFTLDDSAYYEDGKYYVKKGAQVTIDVFDDVSGVASVQLNSGNGYKSTESNATLTVEHEGYIVYVAHAEDHVKNRSEPIQLILISDNQAPIVKIKSHYRIYKSRKFCPVSGRLELSATDNLSGIKILQYKLPTDSGWRTYVNPILIRAKGNQFAAALRAIDRSGNISPDLQFSCIYDNKRPTTRVK